MGVAVYVIWPVGSKRDGVGRHPSRELPVALDPGRIVIVGAVRERGVAERRAGAAVHLRSVGHRSRVRADLADDTHPIDADRGIRPGQIHLCVAGGRLQVRDGDERRSDRRCARPGRREGEQPAALHPDRVVVRDAVADTRVRVGPGCSAVDDGAVRRVRGRASGLADEQDAVERGRRVRPGERNLQVSRRGRQARGVRDGDVRRRAHARDRRQEPVARDPNAVVVDDSVREAGVGERGAGAVVGERPVTEVGGRSSRAAHDLDVIPRRRGIRPREVDAGVVPRGGETRHRTGRLGDTGGAEGHRPVLVRLARLVVAAAREREGRAVDEGRVVEHERRGQARERPRGAPRRPDALLDAEHIAPARREDDRRVERRHRRRRG